MGALTARLAVLLQEWGWKLPTVSWSTVGHGGPVAFHLSGVAGEGVGRAFWQATEKLTQRGLTSPEKLNRVGSTSPSMSFRRGGFNPPRLVMCVV